jgi:PAS domain S-box-containing protein
MLARSEAQRPSSALDGDAASLKHPLAFGLGLPLLIGAACCTALRTELLGLELAFGLAAIGTALGYYYLVWRTPASQLDFLAQQQSVATKVARDELARVAAQLREARRIARLGSWELDIASGGVEWSKELYGIVGLDPGQPAPPLLEQRHLFSGESWQALRKDIQNSIRTGEGYALEVEMRRPDGAHLWVIARAEAYRDASGKVEKLIGTLEDVTERHRVQQELALASERVRLATEAAALGIWDWNTRDDVLVWDETMHRLYGTTEETFTHQYSAWRAAVHPHDLERTEAALTKALSSDGAFDSAFRIVRPDGEIRYVRAIATAHRGPGGQATRMVGVNLDITALSAAERASQQNEALLREFVRHAPAAIAMLDRNMRYLQASDRWSSDYNLGDRDILGLCHYDVFPHLPAQHRAAFERVLSGAVERAVDDPFYCSDGRLEWLEWEARPWHALDGSVGGVMLLAQITTARKQMELLLQRQKSELERSNKELEQFAYVASHDLQEPLRAVAGCGQLLQREYGGQLDATANELVRHMVDGGVRMQHLVSDLLTYSRVRTRGEVPATTDSGTLFDRTLTRLEEVLTKANAQVQRGALPLVLADPTQLGQVFENLIENAIKYHGSERPTIAVQATREADTWTFAVSDNGIGIDAQYFERIFVIFQRLHSRREYAGTGIGLAICKKIVERHDGRIWVESEPGKGSTFYFTLRAAKDSR